MIIYSSYGRLEGRRDQLVGLHLYRRGDDGLCYVMSFVSGFTRHGENWQSWRGQVLIFSSILVATRTVQIRALGALFRGWRGGAVAPGAAGSARCGLRWPVAAGSVAEEALGVCCACLRVYW